MFKSIVIEFSFQKLRLLTILVSEKKKRRQMPYEPNQIEGIDWDRSVELINGLAF